jgi:hypothetical protein
MGLLSRRNSPIADAERDVAALRAKRDGLATKLAQAELAVEQARADRRARLVESDTDDEAPDHVAAARERRDALADALGVIDQQATEAVARLDQERDRLQRQTASKELDAAAADLTKVIDEVASAAGKMPDAMQRVLDQLPVPPVSRERVELCVKAAIAAMQELVSAGRAHAAQVVSGNAQICEPAAQQPANPPAPAIERREVFLLGRSRWEENGETITSGPHVTTSPPVEIAKLAIQHGHAIEAGSPLAVTLQMRQPPNYASFAPADCTDISRPKELTKPLGTPTVIHSEFNRGRGGFATVSRN